jgi:hypothetical protein
MVRSRFVKDYKDNVLPGRRRVIHECNANPRLTEDGRNPGSVPRILETQFQTKLNLS